MHPYRRRFVVLAATVLLGGGLLLAPHFKAAAAAPDATASASAAQTRPVALTIFRGDLGGESNITLGTWGSGAAEASTPALVGTNSIKMTTSGMYQGARLDFSSPIDLSQAFQNPHTYLRFQVRFAGAGASQNSFDPGTFATTQKAASPFKNMRFLLIMADGSRYELVRPVEIPPSSDPDAWAPLAFPLAALAKHLPAGKTLTGDGARLKQLAVFGDRYAQFWVGEIGIITDETEINIAPLEDVIAFARTPTPFVANAEGGASTLHYSWDFDASDGIQEDAVGRVVQHVFPQSGSNTGQKTYKVTLTVSDVDGLKKPQSVSMDLNVTD